MRYIKMTYTDVNNGLGNRVTLWVSGCTHHCVGCHNPESWDFRFGKEFDEEAKNKLFEILELPYVKGLTISGGDPFDSFGPVRELAMEVKEKFPKKDIWVYTGYYMHFNLGDSDYKDYECFDVIVDGPYIHELRDTSLAFRGSSNQRIWYRTKNGWEIKEGESEIIFADDLIRDKMTLFACSG